MRINFEQNLSYKISNKNECMCICMTCVFIFFFEFKMLISVSFISFKINSFTEL